MSQGSFLKVMGTILLTTSPVASEDSSSHKAGVVTWSMLAAVGAMVEKHCPGLKYDRTTTIKAAKVFGIDPSADAELISKTLNTAVEGMKTALEQQGESKFCRTIGDGFGKNGAVFPGLLRDIDD